MTAYKLALTKPDAFSGFIGFAPALKPNPSLAPPGALKIVNFMGNIMPRLNIIFPGNAGSWKNPLVTEINYNPYDSKNFNYL